MTVFVKKNPNPPTHSCFYPVSKCIPNHGAGAIWGKCIHSPNTVRVFLTSRHSRNATTNPKQNSTNTTTPPSNLCHHHHHHHHLPWADFHETQTTVGEHEIDTPSMPFHKCWTLCFARTPQTFRRIGETGRVRLHTVRTRSHTELGRVILHATISSTGWNNAPTGIGHFQTHQPDRRATTAPLHPWSTGKQKTTTTTTTTKKTFVCFAGFGQNNAASCCFARVAFAVCAPNGSLIFCTSLSRPAIPLFSAG